MDETTDIIEVENPKCAEAGFGSRCVECQETMQIFADIYSCGACYDPHYCSRACQVAHWKHSHKFTCRISAQNQMLKAIDERDVELLRKLVATKKNTNILLSVADANDLERKGYFITPIFRCVSMNDPAALRVLLESGHVDVDFVSGKGLTCLSYASGILDSHECMQLLIDHGANPNFIEKNGRSCLSTALDAMDYENVKCLLEAGISYTHIKVQAVGVERRMKFQSGASKEYKRNATRILKLLQEYSSGKKRAK